ncbi:MAG: CHASE3 domain-containing protein [Thermodesulfovibrionales bacterium]
MKKVTTGYVLALVLLIGIGVYSYKSLQKHIESSSLVIKTQMILKRLEIVLTKTTEAETGQRGYIITGDERYLNPYHDAVAEISQEIKELRKLLMDAPNQNRRLDDLEPLIAEKLSGLKERIDLRKQRGFEAAAQQVRTGKGRMVMGRIRKIISEMEDKEWNILRQKIAETEKNRRNTIKLIIVGSFIAFVMVGMAGFTTYRELKKRQQSDETLQKTYDELEQKVEERTAELQKINESLKKEITYRKQAEESLWENEAKIRSLLRVMPDLMFRVSRDGIILDYKPFKGVDLYAPPEVFLGKKIDEVLTADVAQIAMRYIELTLQTGETQQFEYQLPIQGIMRDYEARSVASGKDDVIAIIRDITDRKQAEEKLKTASREWRATFDSTTDLIMFFDSEMEIIKANLATARFFNRPLNEILGKKCFQLFHGTDEPPDSCPHERMKKTRKNEEDELYIPESGIWIRISVDPIFDDKGNITGSVHIIRDITEQKKVEEKLRTYQEQLRSLASQLSLIEEQERRRIATDIHDHIGQTLALCKIKLGTLQESFSSTDYAESMNEIRNLIEQTIQYTRSLTFELSPPILYELGLEAGVEWLGEQILRRHGINFEFEDDRKSKPLNDEARILLFQAVREVLINVAKHAQAHNARVSIQRDNDNIRINVEDDGIGFDASKIDSFLGDIKGFGFFSVRERLNYIGGYIEVESKLGRGTRVTLVAPLKRENENREKT